MNTRSGVFALPAALPLECEDLLIGPLVAFETYGEPTAARTVLLIPDLHHSHRAASGPLDALNAPYSPDGWFQGLVGPGLAIDTDRTFVVCAGLLGSPWGSSSPVTIDPEVGEPYGPAFSPLTATDMARAAASLCRGLGVRRIDAVVGVSFGGMIALRLATLFPELVGSVAALGATAALPDVLRRRLFGVRAELEADRSYRQGYYPPGAEPVAVLKRLRAELLWELYPREYLEAHYGDLFAAERVLGAEAEAFAQQFDARCFATLCEAHARVDLYDLLPKVRARTLLLVASSDPLSPSERARDTYHRLIAGGTPARYFELQSDAGHRAYELGQAQIAPVLREFLG